MRSNVFTEDMRVQDTGGEAQIVAYGRVVVAKVGEDALG
jgi:hypothetical protein